MFVNNNQIKTVEEFKYLGVILSSKAAKPDLIVKARLNAAKRSFIALCSNCRIVGIHNVKVKLLLVYVLVRSVLLYGCILYACMSDVLTTLTPTNGYFA